MAELRGTAQNPDVYFTGRETVNKYYDVCPAIVQKTMDKFAECGTQGNPSWSAIEATRRARVKPPI